MPVIVGSPPVGPPALGRRKRDCRFGKLPLFHINRNIILQLNTYHYSNQVHVELNAKMSPPNPKANSESKAKLANAIQWLQENPGEKATTASRIFDVLLQTIRIAIASTKRKEVARKAIVHRGQNRVLSSS